MSNPTDLIDGARLLELTEAMVSIPSVANNEHEISDWIHNQFRSMGLEGVVRLPVEESGDTIAGWLEGPSDGPTLMFNFHMDTFDAFEGWEMEPFKPTLKGDRLYGVGTHDMKGGAACLLGTVEALIESGVELGGRLLVTATSDEENWSRGAHALINEGLLEGCDYCIVPEPSSPGEITIGQRGRHVFHITFHGRTVHAAYGGGVNAVVDAAKAVASISESGVIDLGFDEGFGMGGSLCVIGLQGGGTLILVPELAEVYIDRHILPGETVEGAAQQIREAIERAGIESTYDVSWDERPTPAPTSFVVPWDSPFVQTLKRNLEQETGWDVDFVLGRSVADTNHIAVHGGVPTVILGPTGGNTCEANEYVNISSLVPVARTYVRTALDLLSVKP
jgi:succinyl-diaminopimelate desuccinylase